MSPDDLIALNEQIAGMARAGLPLDQGLDGLARDMGRGRLRRVTQALADDLRAGHPLPEALERLKGQVPPYYANLVMAGVRTGRLPEVLSTLTAYARAVSSTRAVIIDALFYPAVVLALGLILFVLLAVFVLPQFDQIYRDFGMTLPWITECVLSIARDPVENVLRPLAIFGGGLLVAWALFYFTTPGRRARLWLVYRVPLVGTLIRAARMTAFTELLALLVEHEVPLPEAFRLAGRASSDPFMARKAERVHERLSSGVPLAEAFRGRGLVPEWIAWMAGVGEQRGGLAAALRHIASVYRRQMESRAALLRSILPPIIVLATAGVLIFVFAVAMLLPLVKLLEGLSK
jgi:type IV pilus assembly protein PilC